MGAGVVDKEEAKKAALSLFLSLGLDQRTAENAIANAKVTNNLRLVVQEAVISPTGCDRSIGNLLYYTATKYPANALKHRPTFLSYVTSAKLKSIPQLEAAFNFLQKVGAEDLKLEDFEKACGAGVEVTSEQLHEAVRAVIEKEKARLLQERYTANVGLLLGDVRALQPWADGKAAKEEVDAALKSLLGERTAADDEMAAALAAAGKKKKKKEEPAGKDPSAAAPVAATPNQDAAAEGPPEAEKNPYAIFPAPHENTMVHTEVHFSDGRIMRPANSRAALEAHLAVTGGRVRTRFPPEPNGYLHIGHAKAMNVDFGLAESTGGDCYLRFDDTNPEAEKQEYIDHIQEIVAWLGWKPFKVTYSSDYFQELYELAVKLIKSGHAYVDHQTSEEIKEYREAKRESPWRNRPVAESLALFEDMRRGLVAEGAATLRMKQDMRNENFNMLDLIAYRVKFTPHPHAGDAWCIYPSYDYTHCIVDSLEHVTHSLCTLEFESRRASYFWLLEVLSLYHPHVWEYARLSITSTVLSKRRLNRLVTEHHVNGWDDPRLMTLSGLRRRGATPAAINAFCREVGITRSDNLIRAELLDHFIRDDLNRSAPRVMAVLRPLRVVVENYPEGKVEHLPARLWPDAARTETYAAPFSRVLYIEASDFRLKDEPGYYGLAPGKSALLRHAFPITVQRVELDAAGAPLELRVTYDPAKSIKPKGVLHWVAQPEPGREPLQLEVRLLDRLFKSENPAELDEWLSDVNPDSFQAIPNAYGVPFLQTVAVGDKFQFERLGYYCVDPDSTPGKMVFNRTVTLRDSYTKGAPTKGAAPRGGS